MIDQTDETKLREWVQHEIDFLHDKISELQSTTEESKDYERELTESSNLIFAIWDDLMRNRPGNALSLARNYILVHGGLYASEVEKVETEKELRQCKS